LLLLLLAAIGAIITACACPSIGGRFRAAVGAVGAGVLLLLSLGHTLHEALSLGAEACVRPSAHWRLWAVGVRGCPAGVGRGCPLVAPVLGPFIPVWLPRDCGEVPTLHIY